MKILSKAFKNNGYIPIEYSCQGKGKHIPLDIEGVPNEARSLVLIVDDPDAPNGDFIHWMVWNIDASVTLITEDLSLLGDNVVEGRTSLGKPGWVPPCPPSGMHHYNFKIYALSDFLSLPNYSKRDDVLEAMDGYIVDKAVLVGLYGEEKINE